MEACLVYLLVAVCHVRTCNSEPSSNVITHHSFIAKLSTMCQKLDTENPMMNKTNPAVMEVIFQQDHLSSLSSVVPHRVRSTFKSSLHFQRLVQCLVLSVAS